jgi:hypothetical protein
MNTQRTYVKYIKNGDLVVSSDTTKELLIVLSIKLLDSNNTVAKVTFLNSRNKILQSSGWIALHKITNNE